MERNPHLLIEGCAIALLRDRREGRLHLHPRRVLPRAGDPRGRDRRRRTRPASSARTSSAAASTATSTCIAAPARTRRARRRRCIESLEGKRAQPRSSRRSRRSRACISCPTAVNNVETLCNVPLIMLNGAEWFAALGPEKNGGPKLFCVSGHVRSPASTRRRWT